MHFVEERGANGVVLDKESIAQRRGAWGACVQLVYRGQKPAARTVILRLSDQDSRGFLILRSYTVFWVGSFKTQATRPSG